MTGGAQGPEGGLFDIAVIGAGAVGCAVTRRFALAGAKTVLIEKGPDILSGASKANSAILHTGFDAPPASLELELIRAGREEYLEIHKTLNLPLVTAGALVCAWNTAEADELKSIAQQAKANGIAELRLLSASQARQDVRGLSETLKAALLVEGEYAIDPWSPSLAYLTQALALGARFMRCAEVLKGSFDGQWTLETSAGTVQADSVVNAAGLYGDIVDGRLGFDPEFKIEPRKGQFVVLDKSAARHVPRILLPVPTEITKGIVVCPTAFGNVLVGPTSEEQEDRVRATVTGERMAALLRRAGEIVPALRGIPVTAVYAGLRPASEKKSYRIFTRPDYRAITLGGIRSTGLSSALGLAQHALSLHAEFGCTYTAPAFVPAVTVPNLAETSERDWQCPNHGEILCHCEFVTKREIEATFDSPVPPVDFGGLRRRTRAGMGRCQGFYCNAQLAEMTRDKFITPLAVQTQEKP